MVLGYGLTSVSGNRGENYENEPLVHQKDIKKKNSSGESFTCGYPELNI
jgi:hypothetical protein